MDRPFLLADRAGPRFNTRKFRQKIVSEEVYQKWKTETGMTHSFDEFKRMWSLIAKEYQLATVEGSNGVLMPYGIGELYIGWIRAKERVVDYNLSRVHNTKIYFENFHSYGRLAKIIYHACGRYKLDVCKLWNFTPITPFKKYVSNVLKTSPEIYKNSRQKAYFNGTPSNRTTNLPTEKSGEDS